MKCLVIYPPHAKRGKVEKYKDIINKKLSAKYSEVVFVKTTHAGHAKEIMKEIGHDFDLVITAGGDGTIHETINGIDSNKSKTPVFAFLPMGTANDTAKNFGMKSSITKCLDIIINNTTTDCDLISVNNKYGIYEVSIGQGVKCSYSTKQTVKKKFGWLAYISEAAKDVFSSHSYYANITTNNNSYNNVHFSFFAVLNSKKMATFKLNKNHVNGGGKLTLVVIKRQGHGLWAWIKHTVLLSRMFLFGVNGLKKSKHCIVDNNIQYIKTQSPLDYAINVDGELFAVDKNLDIKVVNKKIKVIKG